MKIFAPNVLVIGDTIFAGERDAVGKPNAKRAAALYEDQVLKLLSPITSTPFGNEWLEIVGNNKEPVVIVPSTDTSDAVTQTFANDATKPNRLADGMARGFLVPGDLGNGAGMIVGFGVGTASRIKFNPAAVSGTASGAVLLVHEVTHAYRTASGRFAPAPMAGLIDPQRLRLNPDLGFRFPNWEEFLAVVVENVFAAELGHGSLRLNWNAHNNAVAVNWAVHNQMFGGSPPPGATDSQNFAKDFRPAFEVMREIEKPLYNAMCASAAWFNPVRDHDNAIWNHRQ
jgi:hypothetical protein